MFCVKDPDTMHQEYEQQKLKRLAEVEGRQSKVFFQSANCVSRFTHFSCLTLLVQKADKRKRRKENAKKKG